VRIKPGKPVYFATRGNQLMFGLPGNPLSATVTCSVFLLPALKKISGRSDYRLTFHPAALAPGEDPKPKRKLIWPGFIKWETGQMIARYSPKKSSAALTTLSGTDGLVIQDSADSQSGDGSVDVVFWDDILS
jgi:molybdopterin molybdotransferase